MFRGEKNTQWEGGFRVPCMIRWPGVIKSGTLINEIVAHEDMIPSLLAAAGDDTGYKVWSEPFVELRMPLLENLRMDPFERAADEGMGYQQWMVERMFTFAPAGAYVGQWLQSFQDFPPRKKPGGFDSLSFRS